MKKGIDTTDLVKMLSDPSHSFFGNAFVFRSNFHSENVLCREKELKKIIRHISPAKRFDIIVTGDHGTGKTTIAKLLNKTLSDIGIASHYILVPMTEYALLRTIITTVTNTKKIERSKNAAWEVISTIHEEQMCLIFDDVSWNEWFSSFISTISKRGNFSTIVFTTSITDTFVPPYLPAIVHLSPYSQQDLKTILSYYINELGGLKEGTIEEEELSVCANVVYNEFWGNCRMGLDLLYQSTLILEEEVSQGSTGSKITMEHITDALEKNFSESIYLEDTMDVIPVILATTGGCKMSKIIRYCNILAKHGVYVPSNITLWRYIKKLHQNRVIDILGKSGHGNPKYVKLKKSKEHLLRSIERRKGSDYVSHISSIIKNYIYDT